MSKAEAVPLFFFFFLLSLSLAHAIPADISLVWSPFSEIFWQGPQPMLTLGNDTVYMADYPLLYPISGRTQGTSRQAVGWLRFGGSDSFQFVRCELKKSEFPSLVSWTTENDTHLQVHLVASRSTWGYPTLLEIDILNATSKVISSRGEPIRPWAWIDSNWTIHVLYTSADRMWHAWRYNGSDAWLTYRYDEKGAYVSGGTLDDGSTYILYYWSEYIYLNGLRLWRVWPADKTTGYPAVSAYVDGRLIIAYLNHTNGDMFVATIYPEESAFFGGFLGEQIHRNLSSSSGSIANMITLGIDEHHGLAVLAWIDRTDQRIWTAYENMTGVWNVSRIDNVVINPATWSRVRGLKIGSRPGYIVNASSALTWERDPLEILLVRNDLIEHCYYNRTLTTPGGTVYNSPAWPQRWDLRVDYLHYGQPYPYLRLVTYLNGRVIDVDRNVSMIQYVNHTTYFIFDEAGTYQIAMEGSYYPYGPWEMCFSGSVIITPNLVIGQVMPTKPYFTMTEDITMRYYKQNLPGDQFWWITIYQPLNTSLPIVNATYTGDSTFWPQYLTEWRWEKVYQRQIFQGDPNQTWVEIRAPCADWLGVTGMPLVCAFESNNERYYNFTKGNAMQWAYFMLYYNGIEAPIVWTHINATGNESEGFRLSVKIRGLNFACLRDWLTYAGAPVYDAAFGGGYHKAGNVLQIGADPAGSGFPNPGIQKEFYVYLLDDKDAVIRRFDGSCSSGGVQQWDIHDLGPGTYICRVYLRAWRCTLGIREGQWLLVRPFWMEVYPDPINASIYVHYVSNLSTLGIYTYSAMTQTVEAETGVNFSLLLGLGILAALCMAPLAYMKSGWPVVIITASVGVVLLASVGMIPSGSVYYVIVSVVLCIVVIVARMFGGGGGPGV